MILLEFTRGMSEWASDMEVKAQHKKNNYSNTLFFLRRFFPQHEVVHQTYIMGVQTTFKQSVWEAYLKEIGLTMAQSTAVQYECVKECVLAGHRLNNTRRSRVEGLHAKGPHPRTGIG